MKSLTTPSLSNSSSGLRTGRERSRKDSEVVEAWEHLEQVMVEETIPWNRSFTIDISYSFFLLSSSSSSCWSSSSGWLDCEEKGSNREGTLKAKASWSLQINPNQPHLSLSSLSYVCNNILRPSLASYLPPRTLDQLINQSSFYNLLGDHIEQFTCLTQRS